MSEQPRPVRPIEPLELQWPVIIRDVCKANVPGETRPFKKDISEGYFAAALLKWPEQWQRQVLILFPYGDEAWRLQAHAVLEFEARCWQRWAGLQEALAVAGESCCAPLWWGNSERAATTGETRVAADNDVRVPYLLRPYIPLPSLRERTLPPAGVDDLTEQLRRDAEWVIGTEPLEPYLRKRSPATPASPPPRRWWSLTWLRSRLSRNRSRFRWTSPRNLITASPNTALGLQHFLSDGVLLVPTRWRPFHSQYAGFGQMNRKIAD